MNLLDDKGDQIPNTPQPESYFEELTKPGGKFDLSKYDGDKLKAAEAIARGKYEGDNYIDHFKARHDELRQDYSSLREQVNAGPKLQELIDQYRQTQSNNQSNIPQDDDVKPVSFDPSKIEELLEQKLTAREQLRREEANFKTVESRLQQEYGGDFQRVLKQQVDNLGLDKDFVNELARKHPQVLFRTLGLDAPKQDNAFQSPIASSQRQDPFAPKNKRTNAYYQKLRKEQPDVYRQPKIQDQMYKDALELGDEFNDGDWNAYGHRY